MRTTIFATFLYALSALSPALAASADAKEQDILATLEVAGATQMFEGVPEQMRAGMLSAMESFGAQLSKQDTEQLLKLSDQSFAPDTLMEGVVEHFEDHYNRKQLAAVRESLSTPLARHMLEAEQAMANLDEEELMKYVNSLDDNPPSDARIGILVDLDDATRTTETLLAMQMGAVRAAITAMSKISGNGEELDESVLGPILAATEEQIESNLQQMVVVLMLYTYRDVSDEDLEQYVALNRKKHMQWFVESLGDGMTEALSDAVTGFVDELAGLEFASRK